MTARPRITRRLLEDLAIEWIADASVHGTTSSGTAHENEENPEQYDVYQWAAGDLIGRFGLDRARVERLAARLAEREIAEYAAMHAREEDEA